MTRMETGTPPPTIQVRLRQAGVLTALGTFSAAPYLYYMTSVAQHQGAPLPAAAVSAREMLAVDFPLVVLLVVLTSLVGCFLSHRYGLGGLGNWQQLRPVLPYLVACGIACGAASYLLFGRRLALEVPGYYPVTIGWALVMPLKAALLEETVTRFGMMTILAGLTRRPWLANVLQALFFSALNLKAFGFFGIDPGGLVYASLVATLLVNLCLGAAYARYGLLAAALMHFVIDLKFVVHAALV
jgi:hypothetical protein